MDFSKEEDYEDYEGVVKLNPKRFKIVDYIKKKSEEEPQIYYKKQGSDKFILSSANSNVLKKNACDIINAMELISFDCSKLNIEKVNQFYNVNILEFLSLRNKGLMLNTNHQDRMGPNCFNTAMFVRGLDSTIRSNDGDELELELEYYCKFISSKDKLEVGDVGVVNYYGDKEAKGFARHAFIYINEHLVFQKASGMAKDKARLTSMSELLKSYGQDIYRESDLFVSSRKVDLDSLSSFQIPYVEVNYDNNMEVESKKEKILNGYGTYIKYYRCPKNIERNKKDLKVVELENRLNKAISCRSHKNFDQELKDISALINETEKELQAYKRVNQKHYNILISTLMSLNTDIMGSNSYE